MKRHFLIFPALLCLLLLAPLTPATAKDNWTSIRTKNFYLVGNANEKEMRRVATRLEQFRDVLSRLMSRANFDLFNADHRPCLQEPERVRAVCAAKYCGLLPARPRRELHRAQRRTQGL